MEVFVLMGEIDYEGESLLGVYASEEEAITARNIYTRDRSFDPFDGYYVQRRVLGAGAKTIVDTFKV
jgi:hypothetical protein